MLVLDTWLSIKTSTSEVDRHRQVFRTLTHMMPDIENVDTANLQDKISNLCKSLAMYWKQVNRTHSRMVTKYSDWLNETEVCVLSTAARHNYVRQDDIPSTSGQQHRKDFMDCSKRSQRRRLAELAKADNSVINSLLDDSSRSNITSVEFDIDEVLSFINESKLTKHQYLLLKEFINSKSPNALPS